MQVFTETFYLSFLYHMIVKILNKSLQSNYFIFSCLMEQSQQVLHKKNVFHLLLCSLLCVNSMFTCYKHTIIMIVGATLDSELAFFKQISVS